MFKKKEMPKPKMQSMCAYHDYYPATFICDSCGKSICYYCQRNNTMPHQCPECMPAYWKKKVKRERMMCLAPVLIIILVYVSFIAYAIYDEATWEEEDYSDIYVSDEDIIPIVHTETYNQKGMGEVDITLKVYVTNWGTKKSDNVFIELYVMKNGTVRAEGKSSTAEVAKDKTEIFEIRTTVITGEWDMQLKIWEGGKVVQDGMKKVRISQGDIEDITSFDFAGGGTADMEEKEEAGAFAAEGVSFMIMGLIIIPIVLVIGFLIYKARTQMPPSMQQPFQAPPQQPGQYPPQPPL